MQHTPGPWKVDRDERGRCFINGDGSNKMFICTVDAPVGPLHEANANMLSAAPDLFDALRAMVEWWAYAMAKPAGAQPDADDHKKVEQLAVQAINALHKADPTYIHRLPQAAN